MSEASPEAAAPPRSPHAVRGGARRTRDDRRQLEKGAVSLDDSIRLYERGEALKERCDALLKNAEMRIEKITLTADGKPKGVAPLDGD